MSLPSGRPFPRLQRLSLSTRLRVGLDGRGIHQRLPGSEQALGKDMQTPVDFQLLPLCLRIELVIAHGVPRRPSERQRSPTIDTLYALKPNNRRTNPRRPLTAVRKLPES